MEAGATRRDPTTGRTAEAREVEPRPTIADPGPLGLAGFAMTTFVLSFFNAGILDEGALPVVLGLAVAYGGLAQLLAGMWEFRTGNTFGAVAFTSFGAFWISFWAFEVFYASKIPEGVLNQATGIYLISWGIFTAYMTVASLRTTGAIALVFILLTPTFFLLGIGDWADVTWITRIGGIVGIATAVAAWYASFAAVTNSTFGRIVLPVKSLKR